MAPERKLLSTIGLRGVVPWEAHLIDGLSLKWYHLAAILMLGPPSSLRVWDGFQWALGFPGGSDSAESACSVGDSGSNPESERSPGEGNGCPTQHSCLENPMDKTACQATVHGVTRVGHDWVINTSVQCTLGDFLGVSLICNPFDNVKYSIKWEQLWRFWELIFSSLQSKYLFLVLNQTENKSSDTHVCERKVIVSEWNNFTIAILLPALSPNKRLIWKRFSRWELREMVLYGGHHMSWQIILRVNISNGTHCFRLGVICHSSQIWIVPGIIKKPSVIVWHHARQWFLRLLHQLLWGLSWAAAGR